MGEQGQHALLEGAKTALDFALCLRRWRDAVSHARGEHGTLEFALWIGAFEAGSVAKEAEGIGVDQLRDAEGFNEGAEVAEVRPDDVARHEAAA